MQFLSRLLFPQLCLYCATFLDNKEKFFCATCLHHLELIPPQERCYYCFQPSDRKICRSCRKKRAAGVVAEGYCFDYSGPAATFIQKVRSGNPAFVKLAASYLLVQFHRLAFPLPQGIFPLYEIPFSRFFKKVDPLYGLVHQFSQYLQVPITAQGERLLVLQDILTEEMDLEKIQNRESKEIFLLGLSREP